MKTLLKLSVTCTLVYLWVISITGHSLSLLQSVALLLLVSWLFFAMRQVGCLGVLFPISTFVILGVLWLSLNGYLHEVVRHVGFTDTEAILLLGTLNAVGVLLIFAILYTQAKFLQWWVKSGEELDQW